MPASKTLKQLTNHIIAAVNDVSKMHAAQPTELMAILVACFTQLAWRNGICLTDCLGAVEDQIRTQWKSYGKDSASPTQKPS